MPAPAQTLAEDKQQLTILNHLREEGALPQQNMLQSSHAQLLQLQAGTLQRDGRSLALHQGLRKSRALLLCWLRRTIRGWGT